MGAYVYALSTKSKKLVIDGVKTEVFPFHYSHKPSLLGNGGRYERMANVRHARLDNVWAARNWPTYFAFGEFKADERYTEIAVYSGLSEGTVTAYDNQTENWFFEGFARHVNGKWVFEKWHCLTVPEAATVEQTHADHATLQGLLQGRFMIRHISVPGELKRVRQVSCLNENDLALVKLALSEMTA